MRRSIQIAHFRKRAGLTQQQLATRLRVSRPYLSAIENGHAPLLEHMQQRIVRALDISSDEVNILLGAPPFRGRATGTAVPSDKPSSMTRIRS